MFFFFKQKTAYEMRISDWSSDVCSSDLLPAPDRCRRTARLLHLWLCALPAEHIQRHQQAAAGAPAALSRWQNQFAALLAGITGTEDDAWRGRCRRCAGWTSATRRVVATGCRRADWEPGSA